MSHLAQAAVLERNVSPQVAATYKRSALAGVGDLGQLLRRRLGELSESVAGRLGATPMQVALAWLLHRSPNILLIPGTSSRGHLRENLAAAELTLPADALAELDGIAKS